LIPTIDNKVLHFRCAGLYNGLALIGDRESGSRWSHYTGECLHGRYRGRQLELQSTIQHMSAARASHLYPNAELALARQGLFARLFSRVMLLTTMTKKGAIPPHFYRTMGPADDRRPRMEIGLGIWNGRTARYYPLDAIREHQPLIDPLDEQRVLIFIDPVSHVPNALWVTAQMAHWLGDELHLDNGAFIQDGHLHTRADERRPLERPYQQFTRWYGFSYTFPDCDIFRASP
jgi:hypothetical protein